NDNVKMIVTNEVGGGVGLTSSVERAELFKAQAVAARSWILYQIQNGNSTPKCGLKSVTTSRYSEEIQSAADKVQNVEILFNGKAANSAYGSCASGYTNSADNMGWGSQSYLSSVESKYDKAFANIIGYDGYYPRTSTIGLEQMRANIIKMVGQSVYNSYSNEPHRWISDIIKDSYGNIISATVCGKNITGGKFFENCEGLLSTNLASWQYNSNQTWTFVTNGYGHGVGLSQVGAAGYIAYEGWNYKKILEHYFKGTIIK
ncbi:MAG: SpoIID/LytB domain-containing protein, partial [Christensenella sp.]